MESVEGVPRRVKRASELPHEIDADTSGAKLENGAPTLVLGKLMSAFKTGTLSIE